VTQAFDEPLGPGRTDPAEESALAALGAAEAARAIARGDLQAEHYVAALIERGERLAGWHAFIAVTPRDALLAQARAVDLDRAAGKALGPLAGVPLAVKDNIDTRSLPTTAGTPALRGSRPAADAPVLAPLARAGALLYGKAHLHELSFGASSTNPAYGIARNPYDPDRIPGGSSGGTAVAVAARIVPAGLGTDTGGSCRAPAALCGIVGFRPSIPAGRKRYPTAGVVPISATRDTVGTLARSVDDIALLDEVITGEQRAAPVSLRGLRLGVPRTGHWEDLDPALARVCEEALARLAAQGVVLVEADLTGLQEANARVGRVLALGEFRRDLTAYLATLGGAVRFEDVIAQAASPDVRETMELLSLVTPAAYEEVIAVHRPRLQKLYADYFARHRVAALLMPTTAIPAPPIRPGGSSLHDTLSVAGKPVNEFAALTRNVMPMSNAGLPGLSLPAGLSADGLPVGLELDGAVGDDRALHAIGAAVEQALGRLPPPAPAVQDGQRPRHS
jgi:mandelamide amidase